MQREELVNHYHHLREICIRHHNGATKCLVRQTFLEQAKQLGLAYGRTLVAESEEEMTLVFDLAIHTAKGGRSRAIDRYAKSASLEPGSDEVLMLDAMRRAQFSVWQIERLHDTAGVVVSDMLRDGETWLLDAGLALSAGPGLAFASRLFWPDDFAMTCGVVVPVDVELMEEVFDDVFAWLRHDDPDRLASDPRFATAIYRSAITAGIMDGVEFREPALELSPPG